MEHTIECCLDYMLILFENIYLHFWELKLWSCSSKLKLYCLLTQKAYRFVLSEIFQHLEGQKEDYWIEQKWMKKALKIE